MNEKELDNNKNDGMTVAQLANLMDTSIMSINRWVKKYNNESLEHNNESLEHTSIKLTRGKETYLGLEQVYELIKIGKGKATADLFLENAKNKSAIATLTTHTNTQAKEIIETILPTIVDAIRFSTSKIVDEKLKLLPAPIDLTTLQKDVKNLKKEIDGLNINMSIGNQDHDLMMDKINLAYTYTKAAMMGKKIKIQKEKPLIEPIKVDWRHLIKDHIYSFSLEQNMEITSAWTFAYRTFSNAYKEYLEVNHGISSIFQIEKGKRMGFLEENDLIKEFYYSIYSAMELKEE